MTKKQRIEAAKAIYAKRIAGHNINMRQYTDADVQAYINRVPDAPSYGAGRGNMGVGRGYRRGAAC